jgi:type VI secretion system Hcp family effector
MAEAGFESSDIYMYFNPPGNIKGEALATGEVGTDTTKSLRGKFAFQVKEFKFQGKNEENIGRQGGGGTGGAGKVKFEAIEITKWTDRATPGLFEALGAARQIPEAVIQFRRNHKVYMEIILKVCVVSEVTLSASDDEEPTDEITVDYASMNIEYNRQGEDGEMHKISEARWNRVTGDASE